MKTKILVECPEMIPSVKVGVLNILEYQKKCYIRFVRTMDVRKNDILWSDIVISVRGSEKVTSKILEAALNAGRYTIMFLDDDLLNIPSNIPIAEYYENSRIKENLLDVLSKSHILWGVNPRIIEKYSKYTKEKVGILGKVPMKIEIEKKEVGKPLRVLYAGSTDHKKTIQKIIGPVVQKFGKRLNKDIIFTFIGANPEIKNTNYHSYFENYESYKKFVKEGNFDIGLAPIETTEFYKSKYHNKFLEYTSIGVLGMYTDSEPYTYVIEDKKNGILCKNNTEDWFKKLESLIENPEEILTMIKMAQKEVYKNYNIKKVSGEIIEKIPQLINFNAPELELKDIKLENLKILFYKERLKFLLKVYGIKSLVVIPYKLIRKIIRIVTRRKNNEKIL